MLLQRCSGLLCVLWGTLLPVTVIGVEPLPRHEYDQRLYLSAGESPDFRQRFVDGNNETNGVFRYEPRYHWRSGETEWHRWDAEVRGKLLVAAGQPSSNSGV